MPSFMPSAASLLQAAGDYLERDLLPTLSGYHRFQTRVSVNVLRIAARELALGPAADAAELARLSLLLAPTTREASLDELRGELARRIDEGEIALEDPDLTAHLVATLRDALAIDNPAWTTVDP